MGQLSRSPAERDARAQERAAIKLQAAIRGRGGRAAADTYRLKKAEETQSENLSA